MLNQYTSSYYALSTMAQSLAAIMGLVGAISLFRLQSFDSRIRELGRDIERLLSIADSSGSRDARELIHLMSLGRFREAAERVKGVLFQHQPLSISDEQKHYVFDFINLCRRRPKIVKAITLSMCISSVVISLNVAFIFQLGISLPFSLDSFVLTALLAFIFALATNVFLIVLLMHD